MFCSVAPAGSGGFFWPGDLLNLRKWSMSTHIFPTQPLFGLPGVSVGQHSSASCHCSRMNPQRTTPNMVRVIYVSFSCLCLQTLKHLQRPGAGLAVFFSHVTHKSLPKQHFVYIKLLLYLQNASSLNCYVACSTSLQHDQLHVEGTATRSVILPFFLMGVCFDNLFAFH